MAIQFPSAGVNVAAAVRGEEPCCTYKETNDGTHLFRRFQIAVPNMAVDRLAIGPDPDNAGSWSIRLMNANGTDAGIDKAKAAMQAALIAYTVKSAVSSSDSALFYASASRTASPTPQAIVVTLSSAGLIPRDLASVALVKMGFVDLAAKLTPPSVPATAAAGTSPAATPAATVGSAAKGSTPGKIPPRG